MLHVADAVVIHEHYTTFLQFVKLHFKYGRGAWFYHRAWKQQETKYRFTIEPFQFYCGLISYPIAQQYHRAVSLGALILVSQICIAFGLLFQLLSEVTGCAQTGTC